MLTVCTSSTSDLAVGLDTVKAALGLTGSTEDVYLTGAIRRATAAAESYLGYSLGLEVYAESVAGYGDGRLMVSRTPVRTLLRLFDSTSTETATEYGSTSYRVEDPAAGLITFTNDTAFAWTVPWDVSAAGGSFPAPRSEDRSYLVEYRAGYTLEGSSDTGWGATACSTGRTLPYDIEDAVLDQVVTGFRSRARDPLILSRKVGDLSVTYADVTTNERAGLTAKARALLAPHRRLV